MCQCMVYPLMLISSTVRRSAQLHERHPDATLKNTNEKPNWKGRGWQRHLGTQFRKGPLGGNESFLLNTGNCGMMATEGEKERNECSAPLNAI